VPGRRRIFFLPKTLFLDDLANVIKEDDPDFDLWYVAREPLRRIAGVYLPAHLSEYDYTSTNSEVAAGKEQLYLHWAETLRIFKKVLNPAAFVTCAYYYREEREFAAACESNGVRFVALHKECITTPVTRVARREVYERLSGRFTGTLITTYNEEEKSTIVDAGCAEADRVDVVGCPRMDHMFGKRAQADTAVAGRFDVVFFSFSETTYLPVYRRIPRWPAVVDGIRIEPWDWSELYTRYHHFAIRFASAHPALRVALKVKTGFNLSGILSDDGRSHHDLPSNLTLIAGGEGGGLAATANVVCGFNSTILLEALAARTPVIVPAFGEAELGDVREVYGTLRLDGAVEYAKSEGDLERRLEILGREVPIRTRAFTEVERQVLERYVGFADGRSAERMRRSIARSFLLPQTQAPQSTVPSVSSPGVGQCR
jgi:hypothetical protein